MLRIKTDTSQPPPLDDIDTAVTIADALREKFGSDAAAVAETQLRDASDDTRLSWEAVLSRLRA